MAARKRRPPKAPKCTVCGHADRGRIDLLLAGGATQSAVARKFGFHRNCIQRHFSEHLGSERRAQLVAGPVKLHELAERAAEEGLSTLDYLALVRSRLTQQFLTASDAGDNGGAALLAGRLLECLRIAGQLNGELTRAASNITNNTLVLSSPAFADLQRMLVERLRPFPDARRAVMEGLDALNDRALNGATPHALLEALPT
jgi:hypothetical protein